MNFGQAIEEMKKGAFVQRAGWNGKGMFLFLLELYNLEFHREGIPEDAELPPIILMKNAVNELVPWNASQSDALAMDWQVVSP